MKTVSHVVLANGGKCRRSGCSEWAMNGDGHCADHSEYWCRCGKQVAAWKVRQTGMVLCTPCRKFRSKVA